MIMQMRIRELDIFHTTKDHPRYSIKEFPKSLFIIKNHYYSVGDWELERMLIVEEVTRGILMTREAEIQ